MKRKIILICEECLSRNYTLYKSSSASERLVLRKHCKKCGKHTIHKETK